MPIHSATTWIYDGAEWRNFGPVPKATAVAAPGSKFGCMAACPHLQLQGHFNSLHLPAALDTLADLCHLLDPAADETVAGTGLGCLGLPGAWRLYATLLSWAGAGLHAVQRDSWCIMALELGLGFVQHSTKGLLMCLSSGSVVHHKAPEPQGVLCLAFLSSLQCTFPFPIHVHSAPSLSSLSQLHMALHAPYLRLPPLPA